MGFFVDLVAACPPGARRRVAAGSECAEYRNFLQDTLFRRSPRLLRLKVSSTASSGGIEPSLSCVRLSSLRGYSEGSSSSHRCAGCARPPGLASSSPDRSVETAEPSAIAAESRGLSPKKISILSASATCSHSSTASVRANGRPAATKSAMNQKSGETEDPHPPRSSTVFHSSVRAQAVCGSASREIVQVWDWHARRRRGYLPWTTAEDPIRAV